MALNSQTTVRQTQFFGKFLSFFSRIAQFFQRNSRFSYNNVSVFAANTKNWSFMDRNCAFFTFFTPFRLKKRLKTEFLPFIFPNSLRWTEFFPSNRPQFFSRSVFLEAQLFLNVKKPGQKTISIRKKGRIHQRFSLATGPVTPLHVASKNKYRALNEKALEF